jgi:hypothetical protein
MRSLGSQSAEQQKQMQLEEFYFEISWFHSLNIDWWCRWQQWRCWKLTRMACEHLLFVKQRGA